MGRTISATLALLASVLALTVGSVGVAQARTATPAPLTCLVQHVGAVQFCHAVEHRVAIRTVRRLAREQATRAHVQYRIPAQPLGWDVGRLARANRWERSRLAHLRELPTFIVIRAQGSWICIHQHEGAWNDTGDPYWGGLQMDRGFMTAYGSDMIARHAGGLANTWTPYEQMLVAQRAYDAGRGFAPWPQTSVMCGVR